MSTTNAYIAGLFDGEGTIGVYKTGKKYLQVKVCIGMQDRATLEWICSLFGGKIYTVGRVYRWELLRNQERANFLEAILPYSRTKKGQVELVLSHLYNTTTLSDEELLQATMVLNKLHARQGPWNEDKVPSTEGKGGE